MLVLQMLLRALCIRVGCHLALLYLVVCLKFYLDITYFACFSWFDKGSGNPTKNPNDPVGVDLARIGLGAPPRPLLVGATPRPSAPGLAGGEGWFCLLSVSPLSPFYLSFADA